MPNKHQYRNEKGQFAIEPPNILYRIGSVCVYLCGIYMILIIVYIHVNEIKTFLNKFNNFLFGKANETL
jgi:hypothetical protein